MPSPPDEPAPPEDRPAAPSPDDESAREGRQPDVTPPADLRIPEPAPLDAPRHGIGPRPLRPFLALITAFVAQAVFLVPFSAAVTGDEASRSTLLAVGLATASTIPQVLVVILLWLALERAPLEALGYAPDARRAAGWTAFGVAAGVLAMAVVVLSGVALGGYRLDTSSLESGLAAQLVLVPGLFAAAHFEEVLFRGYFLQGLGRGAPMRGLLLSSGIFAVVHGSNPGVWTGGPAFTAILLTMIAVSGVWLGTVFLRTGDLWCVTGAHFGWNWAQGGLFGLPVSGLDMPSLLEGTLEAERSLTWGGEFGPESSLVALALVSIMAIEGLVAVLRRGLGGPLAAWSENQASSNRARTDSRLAG